MAHDPNSYYASAAARRLGAPAFAPAALQIPISPTLQARIGRASALEQLGMDTEARYEYEAIEREAIETPALALGAGAALLESGQPSRAIRLGWRAVSAARDSGKADMRGYALIYPMLRSDAQSNAWCNLSMSSNVL